MICNNCGTQSDGSTKFCVQCGSTLTPLNQPHQQPQYSDYPPQQPTPPSPYASPQQPASYGQQASPYGSPQQVSPTPYSSPQSSYTPNPYSSSPSSNIDQGPGSYAERLHSFGRSGAFLLGVILFTVGSLFSLFINFSVFSIITLLLLSLPIIGGFLIFAASNAPRLPEKILPALTLYKVSTVIELVFFCIAMGVVIIAMIILGAAGAFLDATLGAIVIVIALVIIGIFILYLIMYYVSILRVINGIRGGLISNKFAPLRGVTPLMVIIIIVAAFSLIGSFIAIGASGFYNEIIHEIAWEIGREFGREFRDMFLSFVPAPNVGRLVGAMLLNMTTYTGMIICLSVVSKFNNTMKFGGGSYPSARPPMQQAPRNQW